MILQANDSVEARKLEAQEKAGGKCEFVNSLERICLRPNSFISRSMVSQLENLRRSFVGEASKVISSIGNFRKNLWGAELTVLHDCSKLQKIFGSEASIPEVVHR